MGVVPLRDRLDARRTGSPDRGASGLEYAALIVVAALALSSLTALGLQPRVRTGVSDAICQILAPAPGGSSDCGKQPDGKQLGGKRPGTRAAPKSGEKKKDDGCHGLSGCTGHYVDKTGGNPIGGAIIGVLKGIGEGAWSDVMSAYDVAKDPRKLITGLDYALHHPDEAALSLIIDDGVKQAWARGDRANAVGRVIWNAGSLGIESGVVVERLLKLAKLAKAAKVVKAAREAKAAKLAKAREAAAKAAKARLWKNVEKWQKGAVHFDDDAAYRKWLDDSMGPQSRNLPEQERQSVYDYQKDPEYREINESLRGEREATPEAEKNIKNIDKAMKKSRLPEDVITRRFVGDDAFDRPMSKLKNTVQTNKAYTSVDAATHARFRMKVIQNIRARKATLVELHLRVPKGTEAVYPGNLRGSKFVPDDVEKEQELVLHRGLRYRINHTVKVNGMWEAYGTVIP